MNAFVTRLQTWGGFDRRETLPLLTLLLLLIHAPENWYLRTPFIFVAILGLVFREVLHRPAFWYVVATLLGATAYLNWEATDNHRYVFVYWSLTLCAAFSLPRDEQEPSLTLSSRWLIGLCMLFATLWKVCMPDYVSGAFFQYELLLDERFAPFASLCTGLSAEQLSLNRELRDLLHEGHLRDLNVKSVTVTTAPNIATVAFALTWWTVIIEGALAVLFVLPDNRRTAVVRNTLLILFAASTYSVANVRGFGWMLMLLGMAQCEDRDKDFRAGYLAGFLLIQLYTLPISQIADAVSAQR